MSAGRRSNRCDHTDLVVGVVDVAPVLLHGINVVFKSELFVTALEADWAPSQELGRPVGLGHVQNWVS